MKIISSQNNCTNSHCNTNVFENYKKQMNRKK